MNVLTDLLRIKVFREEKAELALARARQFLVQADMTLDTTRRTLQEYLRDCERKERDMYADLCTRLVFLKEINEVTLDIELMKEQTARHEQDVEEAKEARNTAAEQLEQAKQDHRDAVRMREKFTEMLRIVQEERHIDAMRLEDLELEEAASTRHAKQKADASQLITEDV
jgi:type III secretion protein O